MGQHGFASLPHHVGLRLSHVLQQNLIRFNNVVVFVVRQNDVMDRIKRIHPLALGTQHLFEQAEVFNGNGQLLGAGLKEFQFFRSPANVRCAAQQEHSDRGLLTHNRNLDDLANIFGDQKNRILGLGVHHPHHLRLGLFQQMRDFFRHFGEASIPQEVAGQTDGMSGNHVSAFNQAKPGGPSSGDPLQLL